MYYQKFIRDYAAISKLLTKCLKKEAIVDHTNDSYLKSFNDLKAIISSDHFLAYPNFELPFILTTDKKGKKF